MDNRKLLQRIRRLFLDNKGETLLELVLSIGLFGLTMLMIASMFGAANRITVHSYESERMIDEKITALSEGNYTEKSTQNLIFRNGTGSVTNTSQGIRMVEKDGLYKFVPMKP